jgi:copper chaperone CopZ
MSCVNKVRDALRNLEGVIGVEVSLDDGRAYVRVEDGFDADEAVRALAGTGYRGRVISADE